MNPSPQPLPRRRGESDTAYANRCRTAAELDSDPDHPLHGRRSAYTNYRHTCAKCRTAEAEYRRRWRAANPHARKTRKDHR